jgi:TPR repeat protein
MRSGLANTREVDMSERKLLFLMNQEQAQEFARLLGAVERGDGAAACRLGDMYRVGEGGLRHSPAEAFRWYAKSALAGDASGQSNLGACYEHGLGCQQSYVKAVKWYRLSAAQRLGTASMNLGYCYLHGRGVSADKVEAMRLFRRAVAQGETRAQPEMERLEGDVKKPAVRLVDATELGKNLGIAGLSGVARRRSVTPST